MRQAPSTARMAVMAGFCLSCLGLLLFLWSSFGGVKPLSPRGYQVRVEVREAGALTPQAEVRTAGVDVGRVVAMDGGRDRTVLTLELDDEVVPLPRDVRATLRQKTVLGEAYLELSQGTPKGPKVPDGGTLRAGAVQPAVEFDEVLRAFDPTTRKALADGFDEGAVAGRGRGDDVNDALGTLPSAEEELAGLLGALDAQGEELATLVRDTSIVFGALAERRGQLGRLLVAGDRVLTTAGRRDDELEATVRALPALETEVRRALPALSRFSARVRPAIAETRPAARELSGALRELGATAPDLRRLLSGVGPLSRASDDGLPATRRLLNDLPAALGELDPWLAQVEPIVRHVAPYRREVTAFLANATAATQATALDAQGKPRHYLRTTNPINPEALSATSERVSTSRANAYSAPGAFGRLASGLLTSEPARCGAAAPSFAAGALAVLPAALQPTLDVLTVQGGSAAAPPCATDPRPFPHVTSRPLITPSGGTP